MQTSTTTATFDFASLSKETLAKIIAIGSRLGVTPEEAIRIMLEEYSARFQNPNPKKAV